MERHGLRGLFTAGLVVLLCSAAGVAAASNMSITSCPSSVQANSNGSFTIEVVVTNAPGSLPGDVSVTASGTANISGLSVSPSHYQLDPGESHSFYITGTLNGSSNGTVNVGLISESSGEPHATPLPRPLPLPFGKKVTILPA